MDIIEPASQAAPVAIERPTADPGVTRPPIPGHDPVVEGEPERREILVGRGDRRQPLQAGTQVVAEEPDEAAEEGRGIRRDDDRAIEPTDEPSRNGERIRAGGRRLEDRDRIGDEVRPACVATRSGTLEQDEPGQIAECLGSIDRPRPRHAVGQAAESERRAVAWGRDHGPMIRPTALATAAGAPGRPARRRRDGPVDAQGGRGTASIHGCVHESWGSSSGRAGRGPAMPSRMFPACGSGTRP